LLLNRILAVAQDPEERLPVFVHQEPAISRV